MSATKQLFTEDPFKDIQKTSDHINSVTNTQDQKKPKYSTSSYTSAFISSLNHNSHILKVTCHNVISFVNPTKQNQVLQEVLLNQIDILGLSETNLPTASTKFQKSHLPSDYTYFFASDKNHKGSGVALCVKSVLADYIFYHTSNHGRYVLIDLQLRNKQKLRIIQIYLHANNAHLSVRLELEKEILIHLQFAHTRNYHTIIMGDFNMDIDNPALNRQTHPAKMRFISQLKDFDLVDTYDLLGSDGSSKPYQHTWHNVSNTISSRIDYIWCSLPLMSNFVYQSSFKTELYQSDYRQLVLFLDKRSLILSVNSSTNRTPQRSTIKYQYDHMDSTLWDSFSVATDTFASSNSTLSGLTDSSIRTTKHLNSVWDNLRSGIIQAAKAHIPHFQVKPTSSECLPKPITTIQLRIKALNKIYYQFRASLLNQQLWPDNDRWQDIKKALILESQLLYKQHTTNSMTRFIQQRCQDFQDNPKAMLDSLLNRSKRVIRLDRLVVKDYKDDQ